MRAPDNQCRGGRGIAGREGRRPGDPRGITRSPEPRRRARDSFWRDASVFAGAQPTPAWGRRLSHKPPTDPVCRSVMGRPMLRRPKMPQQVGRERRQSDESRYVSHQLGSTAFRTPLCDSRVSRTLRRKPCRRHFHRRCCAGDGGLLALRRRPSGGGANHRMLRWLKTVVASDPEKARLIASGGDQEDVPEASAWETGWACAVEAS